MKKAVSLLLVMLLCMSIMTVNATEEKLLSEMTDEECIAFVLENGISIPQWYEEDIEWAPFIRSVIKEVENDPNTVFGYGYVDLLRFSSDIKDAVVSHYGTRNVARSLVTSKTNILEDNWVIYTWDNTGVQLNCYAYAIGAEEWQDPGFMNNYNSLNASVYTLASYAKTDLEAMGNDAYISFALQTTDQHKNVICFRRGTWYDEDNYCTTGDYHVMRCNDDGYWYHKPGFAYPLKYKYSPDYKDWVYEAYTGDYYRRNEDAKYTGDIWYVVYTTPHSYEMTYCGTENGVNYHIQTCTVCNATTGTRLTCVYTGTSTNCRFCGHNKNSILSVAEECVDH